MTKHICYMLYIPYIIRIITDFQSVQKTYKNMTLHYTIPSVDCSVQFSTKCCQHRGLSEHWVHSVPLDYHDFLHKIDMGVSFKKLGAPNHPSHQTVFVLTPMVTWGTPILGNLHINWGRPYTVYPIFGQPKSTFSRLDTHGSSISAAVPLV